MVDKIALDSFLYHCLGCTLSTALPLNYLLREECTVAIFDTPFPRDKKTISQKKE
jgi:hypothetical protein